MKSKLIAVGTIAFGYGAVVAWAFTADHFEARMKRNQLTLAEMLSRKEAKIVDLEERLLNPHAWTSVKPEAVQEAASKVKGDILSDSIAIPVDDGVDMISKIDKVAEAPTEQVEAVSESEVPPGESPATTRRNLQALIDRYSADPDNQDEFVQRAAASLDTTTQLQPFHISVDLYASDPDEGDDYAKITLTYYTRARVLLDDDEDVIADVAQYVGWQNLNRFGDESGDPDTVFVRNRRLQTDFEVVKIDDEDPPIHVRYGMSREEFNVNRASGVLKFKDEDRD